VAFDMAVRTSTLQSLCISKRCAGSYLDENPSLLAKIVGMKEGVSNSDGVLEKCRLTFAAS